MPTLLGAGSSNRMNPVSTQYKPKYQTAITPSQNEKGEPISITSLLIASHIPQLLTFQSVINNPNNGHNVKINVGQIIRAWHLS